MKCLLVGTLLLVCGLAKAMPSHYHDKGHATSYAVITKHISHPHHGWGGGGGGGGWGGWGGDEHHYASDIVGANGYDHGGWHKYDAHDKHAKYEFDYGVKDMKTGDIKNQWEHRDGDHVKGSYSLKESDGTTRIVDYSANDHSGFNAVVKKIGHAHHPEVYAKPGWKADYSQHGHYAGSDHGYGQATSYAKVKQH